VLRKQSYWNGGTVEIRGSHDYSVIAYSRSMFLGSLAGTPGKARATTAATIVLEGVPAPGGTFEADRLGEILLPDGTVIR
jgi:hypothetical protein